MPNLRLALRMLFRTPALTGIAILSLAIGIGANAAIFSLYNQMLLRPLPVADPYGLVNLGAPGPKHGSQSSNNAGSSEYTFSYPMFRDLEKAKTRFSGIAAHRQLEANLAFQGQTSSGLGMLVSGSYFGVLGLTPAAGRLLGPEDDRTPGAHQVAVLSHAYWRTRFAMSPTVIGSIIAVNAVPMTIVGVAPEGFTGTTLGATPQIFVPISMRERLVAGFKGFDNRRNYWVYLFARLQPGTTIEQAKAAVDVPYARDRQRRRGRPAEGHERGDAGALQGQAGHRRARRPRPEQRHARRGPGPDPAPRRDRLRAADRLRQHRQPAARARRGAGQRDGGAAVDRRQPLAGRPPAPDRIGAARRDRRRARPGRGALVAHRHHRPDPAGGHLLHERPARSHDADLHGGGGDRDRPALRAVPGAPQHPARSGLGDQEHRRPAVRRPRRLALPDRPGDHADRALDDAADPRRAVHQEPDEHQPRRSGHRDRAAGHLRAVARAQRLHVRSARRRCSSVSRTSSPRCRASAAPPGRSCRCWPAATGATASRCRASRRDRTPTPTRCTTRSAPATSAPSACGSSPAATSRAATSRAGPRWRSSTRRSRASSD